MVAHWMWTSMWANAINSISHVICEFSEGDFSVVNEHSYWQNKPDSVKLQHGFSDDNGNTIISTEICKLDWAV